MAEVRGGDFKADGMGDRYMAHITVAGEKKYVCGFDENGAPLYSDKEYVIFYDEADAENELERLNDCYDKAFVLVRLEEKPDVD